MAATVASLGATFNTTAGNKTVVATPTVGDLIVVVTASTGVGSSVTDSAGGTYTQIRSQSGFSTTGSLQIYVRNSLVSSAVSTTYTATQTSSTGGGLVVLRVTGMSLAGYAAVRSAGGQSTGTAGTTPAPVLSLTPLSTNPVIAAVANGTNSTTTMVPRTGYTEVFDNGYNTPATGLEVAYKVSGDTSATLTQGGTSATAFASLAIELAYDVPPTVALSSPADTATGQSTTPALTFTGTDANSDDIRYEVAIDTANTFDSTSSATVIDSYSESNYDTDTSVGAGNFFGIGQTFTGNGSTVGSVRFYLKRFGTLTGYAYIGIYNHTGTYGSTGKPTGSPIALSDLVDVSSMSTSYSLVDFPFSGSNRITLTNATNYVAVLIYNSGDASNYINLGLDGSSPTAAGNYVNNSNSFVSPVWNAISGNDACFYVLSVPTALQDKVSGTDAGFSGTPDNTDPFTSGQAVTYTVQSALSGATTYYWRVRGINTSSSLYGPWSSTRSFTTAASNYSGTPGIATLTLTAQTPTVTVSNNKSVTTASPTALTLTAQTPAVSIGTVITTASPTALTTSLQTPIVAFTDNKSVTLASPTALTTSLWTPTVAATNNIAITLSTASLTATPFTPTVTVSVNQTVTPGLATLTLTTQTPSASLSDNKAAVPGTASLTITAQTPTVALSDNKAITLASPTAIVISPQTPTVKLDNRVTPGIIALTTANQTPTASLSDNKFATPGIATLSLTAQTPTVSATANVAVTPGVASLATTNLTPTVAVTDNKQITLASPTSLNLSPQTPTVSATNNIAVTPGTASLVTSTFNIGVAVSSSSSITPGTASLTLSPQAPTVSFTANVAVTPGTASLALTQQTPSAVGTDNKSVTTASPIALSLTAYAPTVSATTTIEITPGTTNLTLTAQTPTVFASDNIELIPGVVAMLTAMFAPDVAVGNNQFVTPDTTSLRLRASYPIVNGQVREKSYYIDSSGNIYWVISEAAGIVERI